MRKLRYLLTFGTDNVIRIGKIKFHFMYLNDTISILP